jgi:hypothetical protein
MLFSAARSGLGSISHFDDSRRELRQILIKADQQSGLGTRVSLREAIRAIGALFMEMINCSLSYFARELPRSERIPLVSPSSNLLERVDFRNAMRNRPGSPERESQVPNGFLKRKREMFEVLQGSSSVRIRTRSSALHFDFDKFLLPWPAQHSRFPRFRVFPFLTMNQRRIISNHVFTFLANGASSQWPMGEANALSAMRWSGP